jgi:hypothetical protein
MRHYDGALSAGKAFEKAFAGYPLSYPLWGTCFEALALRHFRLRRLPACSLLPAGASFRCYSPQRYLGIMISKYQDTKIPR